MTEEMTELGEREKNLLNWEIDEETAGLGE